MTNEPAHAVESAQIRALRFAQAQAVTERARGRVDEERGWLDMCALLEQVGTERNRLKRGAVHLGESLKFWMDLAVEVTGSQDCVEDDGDGDWGAVAERLAAMKPVTRPEEAGS